ncbi:MAG: ketopantoate reductase family protein, partial [Aristaeellaceae bacterium]
MKLTIIGIGGVGGLLAGVLVRRYGADITLIARGERLTQLRQEGLTLHADAYGCFTVHPATVTDQTAHLPVQDAVLVCVKNGGLARAVEQIAPLVDEHTLVLPVMNGVSAGDNLRRLLNKGRILDSVIYTVSSVEAGGVVVQKGGFTQIFMGGEGAEPLADYLQGAGIEARVQEDVQAAIWSKYVLNCAYNVVTARWGINIGAIKHSDALKADYRALMEEAWQVGRARGVKLPEDLVAQQMVRLMNCTDDSTSSLSRDFDAGRAGEMDIFTGEVVRMAQLCGVDVPVSRLYLQGLQDRASTFAQSTRDRASGKGSRGDAPCGV